MKEVCGVVVSGLSSHPGDPDSKLAAGELSFFAIFN